MSITIVIKNSSTKLVLAKNGRFFSDNKTHLHYYKIIFINTIKVINK